MPFETYATLLNLRKVLPSVKSNYVAIEKDYWISVFASKVGEVHVDEEWYLAKHPDVAEAIKDGAVASALEHYCFFGYFEHRMPYSIKVDSNWYVSQYDDVNLAITQNIFSSAQEHFEGVGFREGRHPYAGFALRKITDPVHWNADEYRGQIR